MFAFIIIYAVAGYTFGTGRSIPTIAAAIGLISVVVGGLSLFRPSMRRIGAPVSLVLGVISVGVGALHAAYAAGSFGTGNGLAGAIIAVVLGLIGIVLGALALARAPGRRKEEDNE